MARTQLSCPYGCGYVTKCESDVPHPEYIMRGLIRSHVRAKHDPQFSLKDWDGGPIEEKDRPLTRGKETYTHEEMQAVVDQLNLTRRLLKEALFSKGGLFDEA